MTPQEFIAESLELIREQKAICDEIRPFTQRIEAISDDLDAMGGCQDLIDAATPIRAGLLIDRPACEIDSETYWKPCVVLKVFSVDVVAKEGVEPHIRVSCMLADQTDYETDYATLDAQPGTDWRYQAEQEEASND